MKYRLASLGAILSLASTADAYVYTGGPNYVNMPGSSCRAPNSGNENNLYHDLGWTQIKSAVALQRVHCPIVRRSTSVYGGKRLDNTYPTNVTDTQFKVNIGGAVVRGNDGSSLYAFSCFVFGTNRSDQSIHFGAAKTLCSSSLGCSSNSAGWTGANTMALAAPGGLSGIHTVNFGITCDVPGNSILYYTDTAVTPN